MASKSSLSEEDFSCPVCHDIFKDPVLLPCSHSFCKACVRKWWREKKITECPVCKKTSSTDDPPCNLALRNLCVAFTQGSRACAPSRRPAMPAQQERHQRPSKRQRTSSGSGDLCSLHSEELKLFCLKCQQPVCNVCLHSEKHTNHSFRPIDEAALDHKDLIQESLKPLKEKLKVFNAFKTKCVKNTAKCIKCQGQDTVRLIREQFRSLRLFLREEEEARITAVRAEEQQKNQMLNEKIEGLNRDISTLSHTIRAIEEELRAGHISFLQNYKTTMERAQFTLEDPRDYAWELLDVAKHLGNLTFRVWEKMKDIVSYHPVILDPCTVYERLVLSDDMTTLRYDPEIQNPFTEFEHMVVQASERFDSGIHSWDVEVGDNTNWDVGVSEEFREDTDDMPRLSWRMEFDEGTYSVACTPGPFTEISLKQKPQKIRVKLDWNRGKLSFSDPDTNTHIHTFTHTFTNKLVPYIHTFETLPLTMLPRKVSITVEHHDDDY